MHVIRFIGPCTRSGLVWFGLVRGQQPQPAGKPYVRTERVGPTIKKKRKEKSSVSGAVYLPKRRCQAVAKCTSSSWSALPCILATGAAIAPCASRFTFFFLLGGCKINKSNQVERVQQNRLIWWCYWQASRLWEISAAGTGRHSSW